VKRRKDNLRQSDDFTNSTRRPHLTRRALKANLKTSSRRSGSDFFTKKNERLPVQKAVKLMPRKMLTSASCSNATSASTAVSENLTANSLPADLLETESRREEALEQGVGQRDRRQRRVLESRPNSSGKVSSVALLQPGSSRTSHATPPVVTNDIHGPRDAAVTQIVPISLICCSSLGTEEDHFVDLSSSSPYLSASPNPGHVVGDADGRVAPLFPEKSRFSHASQIDPYVFDEDSELTTPALHLATLARKPLHRQKPPVLDCIDSDSELVSPRSSSPSVVATVTAAGVPIAIVTTESDDDDEVHEQGDAFGVSSSIPISIVASADVTPAIEWIPIFDGENALI